MHWKIFVFHFNFWYTFFPVFFNSKTGLFSCIFLFEDSFICKFCFLCLHSGFTWRRQAKYTGWPKKYVNVLNMQFKCYTSSRHTTIAMIKWSWILKKVAQSPIFCLLKTAKNYQKQPFLWKKYRASDDFFQNLNSLSNSNSGISRWCVTFKLHV